MNSGLLSLPTVDNEWPICQRAVLPLLLSSLPQPHCCQACLPAPGAHLCPSARPGGRVCARGCGHGAEPEVAGRRGWWKHKRGQRRGWWRQCGRRGSMEVAPHGESGVPVLPERAGRHGSVPHALQPGQQSGLHVHPLRTLRQVRMNETKWTGMVKRQMWR